MGAKQSFPKVHIDKDKTYIVTGANRGIGYEITKWIAMLGGTVVMACRSEDDAMKAMRQMDKEYKEEREKGTKELTDCEELSLIFMRLDLASFQSTKDFVQEFINSKRPLHAIICNAGISKAKPVLTEDGFEYMLQVNYLSHFLMIGHFLPLMKKNESESRIVLVSSDAHKFAKYDMATMNYTGDPEAFGYLDYYGRSKLYQIMQMYSLERRLRNTNISVTSAHPGMVETNIGVEFKDVKMYQAMLTVGRLIGVMKTPLEGANTIINCAVNPEFKDKSSCYYKDCHPASTLSVCRSLCYYHRVGVPVVGEVVTSLLGGVTVRAVGLKSEFPFRDETKQEELWIKTVALLQEHFTQDEIYCLEGADPEAAVAET